jgi:mRNA interferase MazF
VRPVLIVQNDTGNRHSPTVIAAAITSQTGKARLPTHISLAAMSYGLPKDSVILLEQIRTLDKRRLREKLGHLDEGMMGEIDTAIAVSLGLVPRGTVPPGRESGAGAVTPPAAAVAALEGQKNDHAPRVTPHVT